MYVFQILSSVILIIKVKYVSKACPPLIITKPDEWSKLVSLRTSFIPKLKRNNIFQYVCVSSKNVMGCFNISPSTINHIAHWLFQKTLYCSNHRHLFVASVMDSIKTHDKENVQQMFSTRFFNRGLWLFITRLSHPTSIVLKWQP